MKKLFLILFSCLTLSMNMLGQGGTTGPLTWSLEDGILTISGEGAIPDYDFPDNAPWYYDGYSITTVKMGNGITSIGNAAFEGCITLATISIPNSVTSIGNAAFASCFGLTSISIPNSVTNIGDYAFSGCSSLASITISDSVTSIGEGTFASCSSLASVTIPNSVTSIGIHAFQRCSFTSITIPSLVTNISESAFELCANLTEILVEKDNDTYSSENGVLFDKNRTILYMCANGKRGQYIIPNSVTSIGDGAFSNCSLRSITIPDGVTSIGYRAFKESPTLRSITISDGVASIGDNAFYGCVDLDSIMIPNSVTSIGNEAFYGCIGLRSIVIPDGVTNIKVSTFFRCISLTSVTIPEGVTSLGDYVFYGCSSLSSISIPNSVRSIGEGAFYECTGLTSITIPGFVTNIGNWAFWSTGLTSITIPNSVTDIGSGAFAGIASIIIEEGNPAYLIEGGVLFNKNKTLLHTYPMGKSEKNYIIPNSVTSIKERAFQSCTDLTSITISNSVTNIGYYTFYDCSSLKNVEVQWQTPLTELYDVFNSAYLNTATLFVPTGTKFLYEAADIWKDFGRIVEKRQILAEEIERVGLERIGKFNLSLSIPDESLFSSSFSLTLPDGLHLDTLATGLSDDLKNSLNLSITQNEDSSWLFTISINPLRSTTRNVYHKIMEIVYTVDKSVSKGIYQLTISDLSFAFNDKSTLKREELIVNVTVNQYLGIVSGNPEIKARIINNDLYLDTSVSEKVSVYSVQGVLLRQFIKPSGKSVFPINRQEKVLIVKGSSGWGRKIINY